MRNHFVFHTNSFSMKSLVIEFPEKNNNRNKHLLNTNNNQQNLWCIQNSNNQENRRYDKYFCLPNLLFLMKDLKFELSGNNSNRYVQK